MKDNLEIKKLVARLNRWRELYYNEGKTEISDEQFDFEEQRLMELDPNNEYFRQIGKKVHGSRDIVKVEHKVPMLSMQKVQRAEDAVKWLYDLAKINGLCFTDKLGTSVWFEPKLDGISGKIVYDNKGDYSYASTRGDGNVGVQIPFGIEIDGVPKHFRPDCELRGEFVINKKYQKTFSGPLRNTCAGILKRLDSSEEIQYVSFVIYDFHSYNQKNDIDFKDRGDKIRKIREILDENEESYHIVPVEKTNNIPQTYEKYVNKLRNEWPYETDGIILTIDGGQDNYDLINSKYIISTHNKYNMALKPPAEYAKSVVKNIEINVNRQKLSFVASIEPVYINGVKITRASLKSFQKMKSMKIGIGSTVLIRRSNDVIPDIVEAYNEDGTNIRFVHPKQCPVCGSNLRTYNQDLACSNEHGCPGVFKSKVEMMLKSLDVKNIGPSVISDIVEYCMKTTMKDGLLVFHKLFESLLDEGFLTAFLNETYGTEKKSDIIRKSVKWLFDNMHEMRFLNGFNIPSIGSSELLKRNIRSIPDLLNKIKELEKKTYLDNSFDSVLFTWSTNKTNMDDLTKCGKLLSNIFQKETGVTKDTVTFCISGETPGKKKSDVVKELCSVNPNLKYVESLTTSTNFLVSSETNTTKVLKARKYNIPVMSFEEALRTYHK